MLFNSLEFAIFLPIVFAVYWLVLGRSLRLQNAWILVSSYFFYGWWDWRFLSLIFVSTLVDYLVALRLAEISARRQRLLLLWLSLTTNLGILGFFKYQGFFVDNFVAAFTLFGTPLNASGLDILLPLGISFYTLQTLGYTIDVYKKRITPANDFIAFASFVSFFPQLVAGPIERAKTLVPQFYAPRRFSHEQATEGMRQILWGLLCKLVIADNCAIYVDQIFADQAAHSGSTLLLGSMLFIFQVYCDFAGYSLIAIGTANLFGFKLMRNFAYPFFSRDMAELWRRWHISLTTWFRDYIFIPLALRGSRKSQWTRVRSIFVVFFITGLWHGADWTFIAWGLVNALYLLPTVLRDKPKNRTRIVAENKLLPSPGELSGMASTFLLFALAGILFRADDMQAATQYFSGILSTSLFSVPEVVPLYLLLLIGGFTLFEWSGRNRDYAFANVDRITSLPLRWTAYLTLIAVITFFMVHQQRFVYFQF